MKKLSPLALRRQEIEAQQAANVAKEDNAQDMRDSSSYSKIELQFATHQRYLSNINSKEKTLEAKAELLADYQGYIDGVLASGVGTQDDILMSLMVWHGDVGNIDDALDIATYAVEHGLEMPMNYKRNVQTTITDLVSDYALAKPEQVSVEQLEDTLALVADADMADEATAKLHRALGEALSEDDLSKAITHLERAIELDASVGAKKTLSRLKKLFEATQEKK